MGSSRNSMPGQGKNQPLDMDINGCAEKGSSYSAPPPSRQRPPPSLGPTRSKRAAAAPSPSGPRGARTKPECRTLGPPVPFERISTPAVLKIGKDVSWRLAHEKNKAQPPQSVSFEMLSDPP